MELGRGSPDIFRSGSAVLSSMNKSNHLRNRLLLWMVSNGYKSGSSGQWECGQRECESVIQKRYCTFHLWFMCLQTFSFLHICIDKNWIKIISFQEFLETMHQFANQGEEEKLSFLFKVEIPFSLLSFLGYPNGRRCKMNKLASLGATLVRNYDPLTYSLTHWQG